jgi:hypothetical protein
LPRAGVTVSFLDGGLGEEPPSKFPKIRSAGAVAPQIRLVSQASRHDELGPGSLEIAWPPADGVSVSIYGLSM